MLNQQLAQPRVTGIGQPEVREASVVVAMQYLGKASENLLSAYDQLSKRLQIVSRMEPACPPGAQSTTEPSTNCQMADDINSVTALLNSMANQISYQNSILEV